MADKQGIPLTQMPGIGPARGQKLSRLGLNCLEDLLDYFPFRYEDRRKVCAIREAPAGRRAACAPWWPRPPPCPGSARGWSW